MPLGTGRYLKGCDHWRCVASGSFRSGPGGGHAARRAWRVEVPTVAAALDVLDALPPQSAARACTAARGVWGNPRFRSQLPAGQAPCVRPAGQNKSSCQLKSCVTSQEQYYKTYADNQIQILTALCIILLKCTRQIASFKISSCKHAAGNMIGLRDILKQLTAVAGSFCTIPCRATALLLLSPAEEASWLSPEGPPSGNLLSRADGTFVYMHLRIPTLLPYSIAGCTSNASVCSVSASGTVFSSAGSGGGDSGAALNFPGGGGDGLRSTAPSCAEAAGAAASSRAAADATLTPPSADALTPVFALLPVMALLPAMARENRPVNQDMSNWSGLSGSFYLAAPGDGTGVRVSDTASPCAPKAAIQAIYRFKT